MTHRRIAVVIGTRPEAIKMAPIIRSLRLRQDDFETIVISTGQHRQMLDQVFSIFGVTPDLDLELMQSNQGLGDLTCRVLQSMQRTLEQVRPDLLMVQGDTTTVFAAAMASFYAGVPVAHVEAGLRSHDMRRPYPEEASRRLTSVLTDIHFAPTPRSRRNLLNEGIPAEKIVLTGNSVVDALLAVLEMPFSPKGTPLEGIGLEGHRNLLVTCHRRESWSQDLENICQALREIALRFPDVQIIYPVHLNPNVRNPVLRLLSGVERIHLLEPLDYPALVHLMRRSFAILTDSGGIQEEAPTLARPLLVLRTVTERPEACEAGVARIAGTSRDEIVQSVTGLLQDPFAYRAMASGANPYGDGRAAERICEALKSWFRGDRPLLDPLMEFDPLSKTAAIEPLVGCLS